jgi:hypothetical protein
MNTPHYQGTTMRVVSKVTVSPRKNEWGEFVVRAYDQDGKRWPEADYHTDDRQDAEQTAKAMTNP